MKLAHKSGGAQCPTNFSLSRLNKKTLLFPPSGLPTRRDKLKFFGYQARIPLTNKSFSCPVSLLEQFFNFSKAPHPTLYGGAHTFQKARNHVKNIAFSFDVSPSQV